MRLPVHFGNESAQLEVADDRLIALRRAPCLPAIQDVAAAVANALEHPLAFPPLRNAIVPGDHVAIVYDDGTPDPAAILGPVIECLADSGVARTDIQIVRVPWHERATPSLNQDGVPTSIGLTTHDPNDRTNLSYLASTKGGTRVYLNRAVVDADLVVLAGRVDYHPILNFRGTSSIVFPGLADSAAQHQFRSKIAVAGDPAVRAAARREADEVAWLLGVQFALQVVVGEDRQVIGVCAGAYADVQRASQEMLHGCWRRIAAQQADTVVATIQNNPGAEGFAQLGMALQSASQLAREGGRIAVLSAIDATPGTALSSARPADNPAKALELTIRQPHLDAISTWQILQACQSHRIYLLSRLDDSLVEDLSMTPIASIDETQRLVQQSATCAVLNDAPLVRVELEKRDD